MFAIVEDGNTLKNFLVYINLNLHRDGLIKKPVGFR
jgi:hypothetical protein